MARTLSGDILPWERQTGEGEKAYQAFREFLDSDKRRVSEHGPSSRNWSSEWSWSHRAHEYDVYLARVDLEDQVRYRRRMNERHRQLGAVAQGKVVAWLNSLTEDKVASMSTADVTRLLDVAVRIERAATSAADLDDIPDWAYGEPTPRDGSLKQRLIDAGLDVPMSDLARLLHEKLGPAVTEPTGFSPPPRPSPPTRPEPTGPELGFGETLDETPPPDIWGDRNPFDGGRGRYGGPR